MRFTIPIVKSITLQPAADQAADFIHALRAEAVAAQFQTIDIFGQAQQEPQRFQLAIGAFELSAALAAELGFDQ